MVRKKNILSLEQLTGFFDAQVRLTEPLSIQPIEPVSAVWMERLLCLLKDITFRGVSEVDFYNVA